MLIAIVIPKTFIKNVLKIKPVIFILKTKQDRNEKILEHLLVSVNGNLNAVRNAVPQTDQQRSLLLNKT